MLILGIESSCDDTALALIEEIQPTHKQDNFYTLKGNNGFALAKSNTQSLSLTNIQSSNITSITSLSATQESESSSDFHAKAQILGSVMASQVPLHALFGGVVPELASREHARLIAPLLDRLFQDTSKKIQDVDAIAVTRGPGLLGCLLVGLAFAKSLAFASQKPLIGVNHLHAHLLVAGLENKLEFPALGILVSGGHTHLIQMNSPFDMQVLGKTLDDAAGEACDKFGKTIGLPYPGGAHLDKIGQRGSVDKKLFPRPYTKNNNLDFSFSGLKTAGSAWLDTCMKEQKTAKLSLLDFDQIYDNDFYDSAPQVTKDAAASYLYAIADTLRIKAERAIIQMIKENCNPKSIVLAGGVAANSFVRKVLTEFANTKNLPLLIPRNILCTDNGIMVAYTGLLLAKQGFYHGLDLNAIPRGKVIPDDYKHTPF